MIIIEEIKRETQKREQNKKKPHAEIKLNENTQVFVKFYMQSFTPNVQTFRLELKINNNFIRKKRERERERET